MMILQVFPAWFFKGGYRPVLFLETSIPNDIKFGDVIGQSSALPNIFRFRIYCFLSKTGRSKRDCGLWLKVEAKFRPFLPL